MVEGVSQLSKTSFIETSSFVRLQQTLSLQNFSPLLSQGKRWERRDGKINDNQFKETMTISVKGKRPLDERTGKPLPKETNLVDFLARDEQLQQLVRIGMQTGAVNLTDIQNLLNEGFRMPSLSAGGEDPQKILFQKPLDARKKAEIIALVIKKVGDNNVAQRGRYIQEITNAMNAQIDRVGPHAGIALDQADYITALAVGGGDALIMAAHEADYAPYAFSQTDPSRRKVVDTVFHPTGTQHAREFSPLTEDTGKGLFAEKKRRRTFDSMKKAQQMLNREQDVLADLAGAQLLFNDMLPPDVIIEMGLLNLQIQREPDLVKREDLRHELVKKRQKAYVAILQANGVKGFNRTITKDPLNTAVHIEEGNQIQWLMENGHLTEQDVVEIQGRYRMTGEDVAQAKDGTYAYEKMGLVGRIRKRMKGLDRSTSLLDMNRLAMTDMLTANSEVIGNRKLNVAETVASTIQSFDISTRHMEELKKDPAIAPLPDSAKTEKAYEKMWEELQQKLHENGIRMKKTKSEDTQNIVKSFIQDRVRTELKLKENHPLKVDSHFATNVETTSFGEVEDQALKGIDLLYRRTLPEKAEPQYHGLEDENYRKKLENVVDRLNQAVQLAETRPKQTSQKKPKETPPVATAENAVVPPQNETKTETEVPKEIQEKIDQIVADRIKIAEKTPQRLQLAGESDDSELDRLTRYFQNGPLTVKENKNGIATPVGKIQLKTSDILKLAQNEAQFRATLNKKGQKVPTTDDEARDVLANYLAYHAIRKVIEYEVAKDPRNITKEENSVIQGKIAQLRNKDPQNDVLVQFEKQIKKSLEKVEGIKPKAETKPKPDTETKPSTPPSSSKPSEPTTNPTLPKKSPAPSVAPATQPTPEPAAKPTSTTLQTVSAPSVVSKPVESVASETEQPSNLILPAAFQKARKVFDSLQKTHGSSAIPDKVIVEHQADLMVQDNEGRYWQPMPNGRWWKFDNDRKEWIIATPPTEPIVIEPAPAVAAATTVVTDQSLEPVNNEGSTTVPTKESVKIENGVGIIVDLDQLALNQREDQLRYVTQEKPDIYTVEMGDPLSDIVINELKLSRFNIADNMTLDRDTFYKEWGKQPPVNAQLRQDLILSTYSHNFATDLIRKEIFQQLNLPTEEAIEIHLRDERNVSQINELAARIEKVVRTTLRLPDKVQLQETEIAPSVAVLSTETPTPPVEPAAPSPTPQITPTPTPTIIPTPIETPQVVSAPPPETIMPPVSVVPPIVSTVTQTPVVLPTPPNEPVPTTASKIQPPSSSSTSTTVTPPVQTANSGISSPPKPTSSYSVLGSSGLLRRIERTPSQENQSFDINKPLIPQVKDILQRDGLFEYKANKPEVIRSVMKSVFKELLRQDLADDRIKKIEIKGNNAIIDLSIPKGPIDVPVNIQLTYENGKLKMKAKSNFAFNGFVQGELRNQGLGDPNADIQPLLMNAMREQGIDASKVSLIVADSAITLSMSK